MHLKTSFLNALRRLKKEPIDPVQREIRESDVAAERKLDAERKTQGPEAAAVAAAQVAADAEKRAREAESQSKIAKAAAKSASKMANRYRKEASRTAARASAAEVDAAAKAAQATRVSQTAAVDEAVLIINENQKTP